ncbi:DUF2510 domain-containing protein [Streptomyces sp. 8N706]|uniref:DUF2510 domain-containing protein n=1 Tax=Streptomyces sp. 8N706 TaxID=3457416 RepID=UPI003FD53DF1
MTTPPGWYPDPGQTGHEPALERWWDGSLWTDYTREPEGTAVSRIPPQQPVFAPPRQPELLEAPFASPPFYGPESVGHGGARGRTVSLVGAAAVLVVAVIGGIVLLNGNGDGSDTARAEPSTGRQPSPGDQGGGRGEGPPGTSADTAPDAANGISVPVLAGWQKGRSSAGGAGVTIDPYPCPSQTRTKCVRGGVFTRTATGYKAKTPQGVAKEDIPKNTDSSYGKDPVTGKEMYGGVVSRREVRSEVVTVAGQKGYLVRWKVTTKKGDGGFVQSVVFPSPTDPTSLVLVRFGFDAGGQAPPLTDMDRIAAGIAPLGAGSTGGTGGSV